MGLDFEAVAAMLDYGLVVSVSQERGTTRVHRLFFSAVDQRWFVAIQDEANRQIITILPLAYHDNLCGKIAKDALQEAHQLAAPAEDAIPEPLLPGTPATKNLPLFYAKAVFLHPSRRFRQVQLGSWPGELGWGLIENLVKSQFFREELRQRIRAAIQAHETLGDVTVRLGKNGQGAGLVLTTLKLPILNSTTNNSQRPEDVHTLN